MKNPLKRLKSLVSRKPTDRAPSIDLHSELYVIWPAGTWKKIGCGTSLSDMDDVAREILLMTWETEQRKIAQKAAGEQLLGGMWHPSPVRAGWNPSEAVLKSLAAERQWDVHWIHYLVGELQNRGRLGR